jgi:anti-sigma factor RsiW
MKMDSILLMAYVDGELSAEECQEVEKEIAVSPDAAEFVAQLQTARLPYAEPSRSKNCRRYRTV